MREIQYNIFYYLYILSYDISLNPYIGKHVCDWF